MSKLRSLLTSMLTIVFSGSVTTTKDKDGGLIAIFTLDNAIDEVRGSQTIQVDGMSFPVIATDVTEIKCHESDFDQLEEYFVVDEANGNVTYNGDQAILDVSKREKSVWLRKQSFASQANSFRGELQNDRASKLLTLDQATSMAKAATANGGATVPGAKPEPVKVS